MRKSIILVMVVALALAVATAPATAGKKKTLKKSFSAQALPYPVTSSVQEGGCLNGAEAVHKVTTSFKTPGKGILDVEIFDFVGDWDLHITDAAGHTLASSTSPNDGNATEQVAGLPLKKGFKVNIVACNWAGGPTAEGEYVYKYKK
ncbi:MAG: hypothetical protein M3280_08430 [Actinomycetota bacterium]|nr:hypothetical protein [Actinomycetota bacterium]